VNSNSLEIEGKKECAAESGKMAEDSETTRSNILTICKNNSRGSLRAKTISSQWPFERINKNIWETLKK
jgi:hypothetical protein